MHLTRVIFHDLHTLPATQRKGETWILRMFAFMIFLALRMIPPALHQHAKAYELR